MRGLTVVKVVVSSIVVVSGSIGPVSMGGNVVLVVEIMFMVVIVV